MIFCLYRYIERFRNSAPMSREERQQNPEEGVSKDFWWLSDSAPSPAESFTQPECRGRVTEKVEEERPPELSINSQLTMENMAKYRHLQDLQYKQVNFPIAMFDQYFFGKVKTNEAIQMKLYTFGINDLRMCMNKKYFKGDNYECSVFQRKPGYYKGACLFRPSN